MIALDSLLYGKGQLDAAFWSELRRWWGDLDKDRGARARLRRAKTPDDVFVCADFQRGLMPRLRQAGIDLSPADAVRLALAVGVLAHVKKLLTEGHFARQLAPTDKSQESVRDPRFKRLLATTDPEGLFLMLRRLVAYLDGAAELKSLVRGAVDWTDKTRRAFAVEYYVNRSSK